MKEGLLTAHAWIATAIIAAALILAMLEHRYGWARKVLDFIFGPKEKD